MGSTYIPENDDELKNMQKMKQVYFYKLMAEELEKCEDEFVKELIKQKKDAKVVLLPWAFPVELNAEKLENEFFKKWEKRYQRYIEALEKIGIKEEYITIGNCYKDSK